MATSASKAQGTLLQVLVGTTFTTIAEVLSISGPTLTSDTIDVTHMSSTGGYRDKITGLKDGGQISFDINYLPADSTHDASTGLLSFYDGQSEESWKIIFTDSGNTEMLMNGLVVSFELDLTIDAQTKASVTIEVTGAPTLN